MRVAESLVALSVGVGLACAGCGGGPPRVLESISVTPAQATAQNGQASYTATGHFNTSPMTVPNLPASWLVVGPALDPPGPGYILIPTPFTAGCSANSPYTVVAYAPANPNAPSSGPMPSAAFDALVLAHTTATDDGFVAGTAKLNCN
jgi:hypothetical protein